LGDDGTAQRFIRTFIRKGIRFIADVGGLSKAPASDRRALPDKPSIAVLPFLSLSGDPE
jgi:DNA-binding winged helix-turn-helix (wHTH) protein